MGGFCPIFSAHQETAPEHKACVCVCVCVLWEVETLSTDTTRQQKTASLTWTDELQSWTKTLVGAPTFTTCWRRRFGAKQEQNPHVTFFFFHFKFLRAHQLFVFCLFFLSLSKSHNHLNSTFLLVFFFIVTLSTWFDSIPPARHDRSGVSCCRRQQVRLDWKHAEEEEEEEEEEAGGGRRQIQMSWTKIK